MLSITGRVNVLFVNDWVAANVTTVPLVPGNAKEVASVPVNVSELLAVSVLPLAIVSVEPAAGAVMVTLLMLPDTFKSPLTFTPSLICIAELSAELMSFTCRVPVMSTDSFSVILLEEPELIVVPSTVRSPMLAPPPVPVIVIVSPDTAVVIDPAPAILIVSPAFKVTPVESSPTIVILAAVFCVVSSGNVNVPSVPKSHVPPVV